MATNRLLDVTFGTVVKPIKLHFGNWLPRLFRSPGITLSSSHIRLRDSYVVKNGVIMTAAELIAHELVHCEQKTREGIWYLPKSIFHLIFRGHDNSKYEMEARIRAKAILAGTDTIKVDLSKFAKTKE